MNLFKNKLKTLEAENQDNFFQLETYDDREEVLQLVRYISSAPLSLFQIEIIRKDLTAMALEAEQEGISLQEKLGVDPKIFCDEVIRSTGQTNSFERLFKVLFDVLQSFAFYYTAIFVLHGMPAVFGITLTDIVLFAVWLGLGRALTRLMRNKLAISDNPLLKNTPYIFFVLATILLIVGLGDLGIAGRQYLITGTGWVLVLAVDALATVLFLTWNGYCAQAAQNYAL